MDTWTEPDTVEFEFGNVTLRVPREVIADFDTMAELLDEDVSELMASTLERAAAKTLAHMGREYAKNLIEARGDDSLRVA